MGTELTTRSSPDLSAAIPDEGDIPTVPWLDKQTAGLVRAIAATVARRHPDLRAVLLYGSVARHQERTLDDPHPSDVDLLLLFDLEPELERIPHERRTAIFRSIGLARDRYLVTPREVQIMLAVRGLEDWDPTFVANVARDGLVLWTRGPLPACLAAVASRAPANSFTRPVTQ